MGKKVVKNKEFKRIKITEELMSALVLCFFDSIRINNERMKKNMQIDMISAHNTREIPPFTCQVNAKFDINKEEIIKYFDLWNKPMNIGPYVSLISNNSINDLQVYITGYDVEQGCTVNDLHLKTKWYEVIDGKYSFTN